MSRKPIIADGVTYVAIDSDKDKPDHWKGFGGRRFTIKFNDGEIKFTDDLIRVDTGEHPADTAKIYMGWGDPMDLPRMGWKQAGNEWVFDAIEGGNHVNGGTASTAA